MQETLSQLSELNNEAIAESSRTAMNLSASDGEWVTVDAKDDDVKAEREEDSTPPPFSPAEEAPSTRAVGGGLMGSRFAD
jgi:hypothetical protein